MGGAPLRKCRGRRFFMAMGKAQKDVDKCFGAE